MQTHKPLWLFFFLSAITGFSPWPGRAFAQEVHKISDNGILFIRAEFWSNMGRPVSSTCNEACLYNAMWGPGGVDAYVRAQSQGKMGFDRNKSRVVTVPLSVYASSLGCVTDGWMQKALDLALLQQQVDASQYAFKMMVLPVAAGGGSCARFRVLAQTPDQRNFKRHAWLRYTDAPSMLSAIAQNIGLKRAMMQALSFNTQEVAQATSDLSDPVSTSTEMPGLNAPHLWQVDWFPNVFQNVIQTSDTEATMDVEVAPLSEILTNPWAPVAVRFGGYWISMRTQSGMDVRLNPAWSGKLYVHTLSASGPLLVSGPMEVGQRFTDAQNASVEFVGFEGGKAQIRLRRCVRVTPGLEMSVLDEGKTRVSIRNNDLNCVVPYYRLQAQCGSVPCSFGDVLEPVKVWVKIVPDINPLEIGYNLSLEGRTVVDGPVSHVPTWFPEYVLQPHEAGRTMAFTMYDMGGDGICCQYGGGSYYDIGIGNARLFRGGVFGYRQTTSFVALPSFTLQVPASSEVVLSHGEWPLGTPFVITLTQVDALGASIGLPVLTVPYTR
jgi:hypothetical protein